MTLVHRLNYIIVCCDTHGPFEQYSISFTVESMKMKIIIQFCTKPYLYFTLLLHVNNYIYPGTSFIEMNPII